MKPLSTYIEYLLMTRHYAFVPGLGGFMFQEESSRVMLGGRLMPPLRMLKFNRFMDHDDGMLTNIMMRVEGLSFDESNQAIRVSVTELLNRVQHDGRYALGRLGYVFFDDDCHIAFRAADQVDQDPVYYGMEQLNIRTWREVENARIGSSKLTSSTTDVSEKPRIKHHDGIVEFPSLWLRRAAIIFVVIAFIIAGLIPWSNSKQDTQHYANLVDTGNLLRKINNAVLDSDKIANNTESDSLPLSAAYNVTSGENQQIEEKTISKVRLVPANSIGQTSEVSKTQETKSAKSSKNKQYLVIVGSCTSLKDAQRVIRRLEKKGYEGLEIHERNGRYRVYINKFVHKDEAIVYLNKLRENQLFTDAWLLAVRQESLSLSLNIKNKDNDQLPMELSHFNRSAERDQG